MDAKELRIGNLILNGIGEVIIVNKHTIADFDIGQSVLGGFKPIPLTEEWLIKFGCKKIKFTGYVISGAVYYEFDGIVFYKSGEFYYLSVGEKVTGKCIAIQFDKVHEFQNIFAPTEKELTIK